MTKRQLEKKIFMFSSGKPDAIKTVIDCRSLFDQVDPHTPWLWQIDLYIHPDDIQEVIQIVEEVGCSATIGQSRQQIDDEARQRAAANPHYVGRFDKDSMGTYKRD